MKPALSVSVAVLLSVCVLCSHPVLAQGDPELPDYLVKAWSQYSGGVLLIEIPFEEPAPVPFSMAIDLSGFQTKDVVAGNQVGWIWYRDLSGQTLYSGPIQAFNSLTWYWIFDFMPGRTKTIDSQQPVLERRSGMRITLGQLAQAFGSTFPPGRMRILFHGEILQEVLNEQRKVSLMANLAPDYPTVVLPMQAGHEQYVNYIAFGNFGSLFVNQILVAANLGPHACPINLFLMNEAGVFTRLNAATVPTFSTRSFVLADLFPLLVQDGDHFLGSMLMWAAYEFGGITRNPECRLSLSTVYPVLSGKPPAAKSSEMLAEAPELLGEAGLAVPPPSAINLVPVRKRASGEDTGLAFGNPSAVESADITMILLNDLQQEVARKEGIPLGPLARSSKFFLEYFDPDDVKDITEIEGTVVIRSTIGLGVIALNTLNGFPTSSLPSGIPVP